MRYLGSKEAFVGKIREILDKRKLLREELVFFDACCGMGSVSDEFKDVYGHIIVNDMLRCAMTCTKGRLLANDCNFKGLGSDPFDYLNRSDGHVQGFIYNNYSPGGSDRQYFTAENAGRIDYFRDTIEDWFNTGTITDAEYSYLLACLLESVSGVANTAGVYGAFLKHWDKRALNPIIFTPIDVREGAPRKVTAYNERIEDIISDIDCDILYLDPPYTQNQYGTQYHLFETIVLNDKPTISNVTGSRPTAPHRSQWSKKYHSHVLFDKVIAETKARYIIFSYNNDGFMSPPFIETTLKRYGLEKSYHVETIKHKKYTNRKFEETDEHLEYLFFIEKKPHKAVIIESPLNYTGNKSKMMNIIRAHLPKERIGTFVDAFGGGFNVGVNIDADMTIYNDINPFVTDLIHSFCSDPIEYLHFVNRLISYYRLSPTNKEGFLALRNRYNSLPPEERNAKMLYTLILYGFQQQIRFNQDWKFNNTPGTRWFNESLLSKFIAFSRSVRQKNVIFFNTSFASLDIRMTPSTFVYADPPYRSAPGVYNDGKRGFGGWTAEHEQTLCQFLDNVHEHGAKFMFSYVLQTNNPDSNDILDWTTTRHYNIITIKTPQGRYHNRQEVLITNY